MIELVNMLVKGIEPPAYALRVRCSTPELHQPEAWDTRQTKNIIQLLAKIAKTLLFCATPDRPAASARPTAACCGLWKACHGGHQS